MKHEAVITPQGALRIVNRPLFEETIRSMSREQEIQVYVEVKQRKRYRSNPQNAYYFGVVVETVCERLRELGHDIDKDTTHEFLKGRFLFTEMTDPSGETIRIPQKTRDLSTTEFEEYIEKVKQFCAETLDVYVPDANETM